MPARTTIDAFLRKLERRDDISEAEREVLVRHAGPEQRYAAGADMVVEGDRPGRSTLVTSGLAMRYRILPDGRRQITAIHVPGDFVDLHSFLLKEMDHSVGALSECRVVTYPHAALEEITRDWPHLARMLWLMTLLDAAIHREWLVAMGRRNALEQLAHLICELHARLEVAGLTEGGTFDLPVTQAALGDALGLSSVHVNRILQQLRADRLVSWQGATVEILDAGALERLAGFNRRYLHLDREPR